MTRWARWFSSRAAMAARLSGVNAWVRQMSQQTEPLVDFYRKRGKLVDIPDQGSIEATNAYILKQLEA